nr:type II toxin-antitoxin system HicA family toxin [Pseudanabaena sp. lw0831]
MSVKRSDLVKYFEENGFYLLREGGNHSICTNYIKTIPIYRDIGQSIGLLRMQYVSNQELSQSFS